MEVTSGPIARREWRMPYEYFDDDQVRILKRTQPELVDPEACYQALMWKVPGGESYLLNQKNRKIMTRDGPWRPPYYSIDVLEGMLNGRDAFVFCPGPSMDEAPISEFTSLPTLAVNSAGFKFKSMLWVMFESNYLQWFVDQLGIPRGRDYVMTARCAARWRANERARFSRCVFVPRFEELRTMPHRTPAVCTMGAIVTAWWLGASRIWIIGLDLSRPNRRPYTAGVPYSNFGAKNPFKEQIIAMRQFSLPDVEMLNCSPHSCDFLPFKKASIDEAICAAHAQEKLPNNAIQQAAEKTLAS